MGPKWLLDLELLWAKGRPVKSRKRNEMDEVKNKDQEPGRQRKDIDLIES